MLGISAVLGGRHSSRLGNQPYESGIKPTGSARMRFSAKFYLVAIIFVLVAAPLGSLARRARTAAAARLRRHTARLLATRA